MGLGEERMKIINGDCLEELEKLDANSVDSIVTDPPYGLVSITKRFGKENSAECQYGKDGSFQRLSKGFMGKEWDGSGIEYNVKMWQKCLRVLKPRWILTSIWREQDISSYSLCDRRCRL